MPGRFADFARSKTPSSPVLPIVHTTDWWAFLNILEGSATLTGHLCPVFNEHLLYLYYGKPSYRAHPDVEPTSLSSYFLVSILFEPTSVGGFHRVHPFDTGAFAKGVYKANVHPKMRIEDFELYSTLQAATEAVDVFYGSNSDYYRGKAKDNLAIGARDIEVEAFLSIIRTPARTTADDRRSAIEIQINGSIDIHKSRVAAVVLPEQLLDDPFVENFIVSVLGAQPLGYYCPHARPDEDVRAIMIEAKRFYEANSLL